jgi:hypothetical protein
MTDTLNNLKITDIIYCEHKSKCKWKGFALDGNGYGIGKVENYLQEWKDWHEKECGGKLIQAVIVKEDYLSIIRARVDAAGLTDEQLHKIHGCDDVCESDCNNCSGCSLIKQVAGFQLQSIKDVLK